MKTNERFKSVDIVAFLIMLYFVACALLNQFSMLYGLPFIAKIAMIGVSAIGTIYLWRKYKRGEYQHKGILWAVILGTLIWSIIMFIG